jgi:GNAT superfamily N-acetyltransferase
MQDIIISPAGEQDIPALTALVNSAYRGDSARKGWTHEADLLGGQRTDPESLASLMTQAVILKCLHHASLTGCVCLEKQETIYYLGMLTVSPEHQGKGIGKALLMTAEQYALQQGAIAIEMTVITARKELIAWYKRHGYTNTGETRPFPSGDPRFGIPLTFLEFTVLRKELIP